MDAQDFTPYLDDAAIERFWAKVDKSPGQGPNGQCWTWTGCTNSGGYGQFFLAGAMRQAHRVAWTMAHGPIPPDHDVLHHCDNPPCCNEECLFVGTHDENMADKVRKGRQSRLFGDRNGARLHPERMPRGERNVRSKLTETDRVQIRAALARGESNSAIGRAFGVSHQTIRRVAGKA